MDLPNTDLQFMWMNFFGQDKSPWFSTEMPTDSKDLVSMDFLITQTPFPARRVPKYTG